MLDSLLQLRKANFPIEVTLSGTLMLVRLVQPQKADHPIEVTLSGIEILSKLLQPKKTLEDIEVTLYPSIYSGITSSPLALVSQSVIVT